jgi:hypothetical protein
VVLVIAAVSDNGNDTDPAAASTQPTVTVTAQPTEPARVNAPASSDPAPSASVPAPSSSAPAPAQAKAPKPAKARSDGPWTMPDEVGKDLQAAQDHIQGVTDNPFFFTDSMDATGADRFQILDVDWTVCSQKPAAGSSFGENTDIVFFVVKDWEECP